MLITTRVKGSGFDVLDEDSHAELVIFSGNLAYRATLQGARELL